VIADLGGEGGDSSGAAGGGFVLGGVAGGLIGSSFGGGRGQMAARGVAQFGQLLQIRSMIAAQSNANLNRAITMSHVNPGTPHQVVQTNMSETLVKLGTAAAQLTSQILANRAQGRAARSERHQQQQLAHKIQRALNRSPAATYQDIALTGLNNGPPIPGATYY
jgi:hypothetical protein